MKRLFLIVVSVVFLGACAMSANHPKLSASSESDSFLTCEQLEEEAWIALKVKKDIEFDKKNISAPDVIDTVLWFPLNLLVKWANYSDAGKAADARIVSINKIEAEKGCSITRKIGERASEIEDLNKKLEEKMDAKSKKSEKKKFKRK